MSDSRINFPHKEVLHLTCVETHH